MPDETKPFTSPSAPPAPAPRVVPFAMVLKLLPANLQIMFVVMPLVAIGALVWFLIDINKASFTTLFAACVMQPIYAVMIWSHRRKLIHFDAVAATITDIRKGEGAFSGAKVVAYEYEVNGQPHDDTHMTADAKGLEVGGELWVLVDPKDAKQSIAWF